MKKFYCVTLGPGCGDSEAIRVSEISAVTAEDALTILKHRWQLHPEYDGALILDKPPVIRSGEFAEDSE